MFSKSTRLIIRIKIIYLENVELTPNNWNSTDPCKILCLHGGGSSASGLRQQTGMQDLMSEVTECEFVFGQTPEDGGVWVQG